ncbi:MAG: hypothetical protein IH577_04520 [Deltaproteobacteria bacterium]|nr:hypothetical protein [Deltaproteobacteria bacterium]
MATDLKDRVLETITRRQPCASGPLLQNLKICAEELKPFLGELEKEGKITTWTKGRAVRFTLKGAPNPFPASDSPSKNEEKPEARKPETPKARKPAAPRAAAPSHGDSSILAAIAELEAKRSKIDAAIEVLRALA